jgi:hypothetical protein
MSHLSAFSLINRVEHGQKPLANRPMNAKRNDIINLDQPVPKKTKIVQSKNEANTDAGSPTEIKGTKAPRERRAIRGQKPRKTSAAKTKTTTAQTGISTFPREPEAGMKLSDDAIRLRAYFISERRRRFALQGDAESDWLEAKRQLLAELPPR